MISGSWLFGLAAYGRVVLRLTTTLANAVRAGTMIRLTA